MAQPFVLKTKYIKFHMILPNDDYDLQQLVGMSIKMNDLEIGKVIGVEVTSKPFQFLEVKMIGEIAEEKSRDLVKKLCLPSS